MTMTTLPKLDIDERVTLDQFIHRDKLYQLHLHWRKAKLEEERPELVDKIGDTDASMSEDDLALIHGLDDIEEDAGITEADIRMYERWGEETKAIIGQFGALMTFYAEFPEGDDQLHDELDLPKEKAVHEALSSRDKNRYKKANKEGAYERVLMSTEVLIVGYFIELVRTNSRVNSIIGEGVLEEKLEKCGYKTPKMVRGLVDEMKHGGVMFSLPGAPGIGKTHMLHSLFVRCEEILGEVLGDTGGAGSPDHATEIMKSIWTESAIFDAKSLENGNLPDVESLEQGTIIVMDDLFAKYVSLTKGRAGEGKPKIAEIRKLGKFIFDVHEKAGVLCLMTTNFTTEEIQEVLKNAGDERSASRANIIRRLDVKDAPEDVRPIARNQRLRPEALATES